VESRGCMDGILLKEGLVQEHHPVLSESMIKFLLHELISKGFDVQLDKPNAIANAAVDRVGAGCEKVWPDLPICSGLPFAHPTCP
jgi:hypothetical protein